MQTLCLFLCLLNLFIRIFCLWCLIIFNLAMWNLITNRVLIKLTKKLGQLNSHIVQTLFCSCLQQPELLAIAICFDTMMDNQIAIIFHLSTDKTKATHDEQKFLELEVYLAHDMGEVALFCDIALFFLKPSI